ncbi:MAG: glycosyltransferase involved in cell wall biosynthesis [Pseudoalteromonas distincta]
MKKEYPLVSIAIITYNQIEYLRECIESCLAQDYPNFEVVVADDCSNDGTQDMLASYKEEYPEIINLCLSKKNSGITSNSNAANSACKGEYVAWLGGDDIMLPGKLTKQVRFMEENLDITISYHDLDVFMSSTNETLHKFSQVASPREGGVELLIRYGCFFGASSAMVRKIGSLPAFDKRIPIASDWLYWIRCLELGGQVGFLPEVLGRYRRHSKNVTAEREYLKNSSLQDHFITCAILKSEYPKLISLICSREAELLFQCISYRNCNRVQYKLAALKNKFNIKNLYRFLFR